MDSSFAREIGKGLSCLLMVALIGIVAIIAWAVYFVWMMFT